ncbi:hypothetical protein LPN04_31260 [Rugamonas sp. A1-17]|nr:hypothetical protein [Rugamonas sp. A1-17]
MNAIITFKDNVTIEVAVDALAPLMQHYVWTRDDILNHAILPGEDFVEIVAEGSYIRCMTIYTCGDVDDSYRTMLTDFARNLSTLAEPGHMELSDHDTPDLQNAIEKIWYGEPTAVEKAQVQCAWLAASDALRAAAVPESTLIFIAHCLESDVDNAAAIAAGKASRADDANLYFDELQTKFGALVDIGREFGQDTVRDLFYVHASILNDTYVEHFKQDSQLLEVLDQLPSASKWTKFASQP